MACPAQPGQAPVEIQAEREILFMKQILIVFLAALLPAMQAAAEPVAVPLAPVPYQLLIPAEIAERLSTAPVSGPFAQEAAAAGVQASVTVLYEPEGGTKTILLSAYYFPEARFDAAQNPDEPPPFGKAVIREGGMVLSIAGPHDSIYEAGTPDAANVNAMSTLIYEANSYSRTE